MREKCKDMEESKDWFYRHNSMVITGGKGGGRVVMAKGVQYIVTGDLTLGCKHTTKYTDDVLGDFTLEAYIILLTNITSNK